MFSNVITMLNEQIEQLEAKKSDIEGISYKAHKITEDITEILSVISAYPDEKQMFTNTILGLLGVSGNVRETAVVAITNGDSSTVQETNEILPELLKVSEQLLTDNMGKYYIYFDNLRSRGGANSLNLWKTELIGVNSSLVMSSKKVFDKYLMIIANADEQTVDYLKSIDFGKTPEDNAYVAEVTSTVANVQEVVTKGLEESAPVEPPVTTVTVNEFGNIEESSTVQLAPFSITKLETNHKMGKAVVAGEHKLFIAFDVVDGFADKSNARLWQKEIQDMYPDAVLSIIPNFASSNLEGECLLSVSGNIIQLLELTKYDYTLTPVKARFHGTESLPVELPVQPAQVVEQQVAEVKAAATTEQVDELAPLFDPEAEFSVI